MTIKVAITGHTSGLGKAVYEQCIFAGYDVTGYSRSNGWDIAESRTWDEICWNDYDVVINNAWHPTGQVGLLKQLVKHWGDEKKTIVNVGSWGSDFPYREKAFDYAQTKKTLENYSNLYSVNNKTVRSIMFKPGFIDTPMAAKAEAYKMNADDVAEVLMYITFEAPESFKEVTMIPYDN